MGVEHAVRGSRSRCPAESYHVALPLGKRDRSQVLTGVKKDILSKLSAMPEAMKTVETLIREAAAVHTVSMWCCGAHRLSQARGGNASL